MIESKPTKYRVKMNKLLCTKEKVLRKLLILGILFLGTPSNLPAKELVLPSKFENNQIYLIPTLLDNKQIKFFTDTGGGWNAISREFHNIHNLKEKIKKTDKGDVTLSEMPQFIKDKSIPLGGLNNFMEGYLFIVDKEKLIVSGDAEGFLGGRWHAEKIIFFDYLAQKISILDSITDLNVSEYDVVSLGFQKNNNQYTTAFPSIEIKVSGTILPMLFDTGATAKLSKKAKDNLKIKSNQIGTSYIVASIFDEWRKNNPSWKVLEGADTLLNEAMIKVPKVQIANRTIGPVWFTRRQNNHLHNYMSSMMDRKIDGAIGGSLLKYIRVIVDYPNEKAYVSDD